MMFKEYTYLFRILLTSHSDYGTTSSSKHRFSLKGVGSPISLIVKIKLKLKRGKRIGEVCIPSELVPNAETSSIDFLCPRLKEVFLQDIENEFVCVFCIKKSCEHQPWFGTCLVQCCQLPKSWVIFHTLQGPHTTKLGDYLPTELPNRSFLLLYKAVHHHIERQDTDKYIKKTS